MSTFPEILTHADIARFWSNVTKSAHDGACWLWNGSVFSNGYGAFWFAGQNRKANRVSHEVAIGPIPDGLHVLHRCDVKLCVNPAHLYAGDHQQNMDDKVTRGRQARGDNHYSRTRPELLARGDKHSSQVHPEIAPARAKMTESDVALIRKRSAEGASHREIAREIGVGHASVGNVLRGKTWRPIEPRSPS